VSINSNIHVEEKLDPRVQRTRSMLSQAFSEVLQEKGFQSASIQDITKRAGVNRSTFYLHFTDKYALLEYNITEMFRDALEKKSLSLCHFSPQNLHALIVTVAEFITFASSHCNHTESHFEAMVQHQVLRQIAGLLNAWGKHQPFGAESEMVTTAASWAIYGLAQEWSKDKNHPPADEFAKKISPLILAILWG
jgi:AcrR family transcriptional regulator